MIGINIITKEGILLFSHFFLSVFSDVDGDLRAGLMTAVLNAMKETQANQGIKVIDQGRYFVHIAEGELTYCLLFSQDNALTEHRFAQSILKQFEVLFGDYVATQVSFSETEFNDFSKYVIAEYNKLMQIDVAGLSAMIETMNTSFFTDFIILEKPNLHQVFTTISSYPEIHPYANQIGTMCKNLIESSIAIGQEITQLQFNLGGKYLVIVERFKKYLVVLIILRKDHEKALKEILRIRNKITS